MKLSVCRSNRVVLIYSLVKITQNFYLLSLCEAYKFIDYHRYFVEGFVDRQKLPKSLVNARLYTLYMKECVIKL